MGLGGFLLGIGFLGAMSRFGGLHQGDLTMAGSIGLFVAANGGVIAGALYAAVPTRRRTLVATLAAGFASPFLFSGDGFEIFRDMLDSPSEAATNLSITLLPFLFGWLFARAMAGSRWIPLISWARRNVARVPDELPRNRRGLAFVFGAIPAWLVVMAGCAAFASGFAFLEKLLPLPARPPGWD